MARQPVGEWTSDGVWQDLTAAVGLRGAVISLPLSLELHICSAILGIQAIALLCMRELSPYKRMGCWLSIFLVPVLAL